MSTAEKRLITPTEYLAMERQAEFKSEYFRGEMFATTGASRKHNLIKHFVRDSAERWLMTDFGSLNEEVVLPAIPCSVAVRDIYDKIEFDESTT
jgi:hypothetical protein